MILHRLAHFLGWYLCKLTRHTCEDGHEWLMLKCVKCGQLDKYIHSKCCGKCEETSGESGEADGKQM